MGLAFASKRFQVHLVGDSSRQFAIDRQCLEKITVPISAVRCFGEIGYSSMSSFISVSFQCTLIAVVCL